MVQEHIKNFNKWLSITYTDGTKKAYYYESLNPGQYYLAWFIDRAISKTLNAIWINLPERKYWPHSLLVRYTVCGLVGHDDSYRRYNKCGMCGARERPKAINED